MGLQIKTFFVLILFLIVSTACKGVDQLTEDGDSSLASENASRFSGHADHMTTQEEVNYLCQFQYVLSNCEGPFAEGLNNRTQNGYFQIKVNRERIQFLRPEFKKSMNVKVASSWSAKDNSLSRMRGQFGISNDEDWRGASGQLVFLLNDSIEGKIINIKVNKDGNFCDVSLKLTGNAVDNNIDPGQQAI